MPNPTWGAYNAPRSPTAGGREAHCLLKNPTCHSRSCGPRASTLYAKRPVSLFFDKSNTGHIMWSVNSAIDLGWMVMSFSIWCNWAYSTSLSLVTNRKSHVDHRFNCCNKHEDLHNAETIMYAKQMVMSWKWCKIETWLLATTYIRWICLYRCWWPSTLNDLKLCSRSFRVKVGSDEQV